MKKTKAGDPPKKTSRTQVGPSDNMAYTKSLQARITKKPSMYLEKKVTSVPRHTAYLEKKVTVKRNPMTAIESMKPSMPMKMSNPPKPPRPSKDNKATSSSSKSYSNTTKGTGLSASAMKKSRNK